MTRKGATVVATGEIVEGRLRIQHAGYLRVATHGDGAMVSLVPVPMTPGERAGEIDVIEVGPEETFVEVVKRLGGSPAAIMQAMFGSCVGE